MYMAGLAFAAYGVHWWALGLNRAFGGDPRLNGFMSVAFITLSVLGVVVFFGANDWPVAVLFIGLTLVYVAEFFSSLFHIGERPLGLVPLPTGVCLMHLTPAPTLNFPLGYKCPL